MKDSVDLSYLDAFIESGDNLIEGNVQIEDGKPNATTVEQLSILYQQIELLNSNAETIRKAIQLLMLKAIQEDNIQSNHHLTPDSLGMIIGYILMRLVEKQHKIILLDPAVGTANLLTAVINQLSKSTNHILESFGFDNDDSMLSVADISITLQNANVDLKYQDSIDEFLISPVDVVISDLPVGYYPIDKKISLFETSSKKHHSYVHHLLIEQSIKNLKSGGFAVLLVPSQIFSTSEAKKLMNFLQKTAYLQAFLSLPNDLFSDNHSVKSILLLQRSGENAHQADKVLIGEFPSFKDISGLQNFLSDVVDWEINDLLAVK